MNVDLTKTDLVKSNWRESDKEKFVNLIKSLGKGEKSVKFEKNILKTNYECVAVSAKNVDKIVNLIHKGNFLSFIDLWIRDNYTCLLITGKLIAKIKDFNLFKDRLMKYISYVDSWGCCDCLKLSINKNNEEKFFELSNELILSQYPFYRRLGLIILFKFINEKYIDKILKICSSLINEKNYYVNMANSWLLTECFIKQRDKTLNLIKTKTLNKFVQNKTISKCNDSFRVAVEDKKLLKSYFLD